MELKENRGNEKGRKCPKVWKRTVTNMARGKPLKEISGDIMNPDVGDKRKFQLRDEEFSEEENAEVGIRQKKAREGEEVSKSQNSPMVLEPY